MTSEPVDPYRATILALVRKRGADKSACPSEVARVVAPEDWRSHMAGVRAAARDLAKAGQLRITQGNESLDAEGEWRGPIRLRLL